MFRVLYILAVAALLGGSAVTAASVEERGPRLSGGVGLVLLASLQR